MLTMIWRSPEWTSRTEQIPNHPASLFLRLSASDADAQRNSVHASTLHSYVLDCSSPQPSRSAFAAAQFQLQTEQKVLARAKASAQVRRTRSWASALI